MKNLIISVMLLILIPLAFFVTTAGYNGAIIINKNNSEEVMSKPYIKQIYKGKVSGWEVLEQKKGSSIRDFFSILVMGKSAGDMERYYKKRSLSGKGQPPKVVNSSDEVISYVMKNKNAIGYIEASKVSDSVVVVYEF